MGNLAQYYATEALRLIGEAIVPPDIALAERLLAWLQHSWHLNEISLPDVYQRSLNAIGDKATAQRIVDILENHGWLIRISGGALIEGVKRKDAWRIIYE